MSDPRWQDHCGDRWRDQVLAATGRDICDTLGPSPRGVREWAAMMKRVGARSLRDVVTAVHGQPVPYRQARRGDIVRIGWALGVCRGATAEFYGGVMLATNTVDDAWRV